MHLSGDVSRIDHRSHVTTGFLVASHREWSLTVQSKKRRGNSERNILFSREENAKRIGVNTIVAKTSLNMKLFF